MDRDSRRAIVIACGISLFLLALAGTTTLWDRDEPRFAQAAVEMVESGDYLVPTFNGELRAQKPIFVYWLMSLSLRVFGKTEIAFRLWSPLAIGVAAFATFVIGRRFWSARVGMAAMGILALTPLTIIEGSAATTDAVLLAATTTSLAVASAILLRKLESWEVVGLGCLLGVGLLTKGPVGLLVPVSIVTVAYAGARRRIEWHRSTVAGLATATALAIAIYAAWLVPANAATSGRLAVQGLIRENVGRLLMPMEGHGTSLWLAPFYYPAVIAIGFAPWSLYLFRRSGCRLVEPAGALIAAWIAVPLLMFTLAATKLPHYVLPIWPALALYAASVLVQRQAEHTSSGQEATGGGHFQRRLAIAAVAVLLIVIGAAPLAERVKPVPELAATIRAAAPAGPVFVYEFDEPSLVFYTGRRVISLADDAALVRWAREPAEGILVSPRSAITAIELRHGSLELQELTSERGWNYVKGRQIDLVALLRHRDR